MNKKEQEEALGGLENMKQDIYKQVCDTRRREQGEPLNQGESYNVELTAEEIFTRETRERMEGIIRHLRNIEDELPERYLTEEDFDIIHKLVDEAIEHLENNVLYVKRKWLRRLKI